MKKQLEEKHIINNQVYSMPLFESLQMASVENAKQVMFYVYSQIGRRKPKPLGTYRRID